MSELYNKKAITAIRENKGYDFIANHYYEFTKDELKDIILECLYVLDIDDILDNIADELEERWNCNE